MKKEYDTCIVELVRGDITELEVDAIVNAANEEMQLGFGVAGAIRTKGGPTIQEECNKIGKIPTGTATITGGGNLKANYVIHAVGPTAEMEKRDDLLKSAIIHSLTIAKENKLTSIAFPAISTGIYGFPITPASQIILKACISIAKEESGTLEKIILCLFDNNSFNVFTKSFELLAFQTKK